MTCKGTLKGHNGWITQIATTPVFPDMLLSASRDKTIIMWQLTRDESQYGIPKRRLNGHSHFVSEEAKPLHTLDSGDEINALSFSPNRYWLCAAAGAIIKIWDLEQKVIVEELKPEVMGHKEGSPPVCTSLCWSSDGQTLFAGYTDNLIRVWSLSVPRSLA